MACPDFRLRGRSDVLEPPYTAGGAGGGYPPLPPLPMFEADSQNFSSVPRGFTLKIFWPAFGGDHRGTLGGGRGPSQTPLPPPLQTPIMGAPWLGPPPPLQTPIPPFQYIPARRGGGHGSPLARTPPPPPKRAPMMGPPKPIQQHPGCQRKGGGGRGLEGEGGTCFG